MRRRLHGNLVWTRAQADKTTKQKETQEQEQEQETDAGTPRGFPEASPRVSSSRRQEQEQDQEVSGAQHVCPPVALHGPRARQRCDPQVQSHAGAPQAQDSQDRSYVNDGMPKHGQEQEQEQEQEHEGLPGVQTRSRSRIRRHLPRSPGWLGEDPVGPVVPPRPP